MSRQDSSTAPSHIRAPFPEIPSGTLCLPAIGRDHYPAVILLHGFASHRDEVGGFYRLQADALAAAGIASFRFTFRGFDQPAETAVNTSLDEMVAEVQTAAAALSTFPQMDSTRLGLLGFSLGGAIAVLAAAGAPEQYRALATWSCAAELETHFRELISPPLFQKGLQGEEVTVDLGWRRIRLGPGFIRSLPRHRPLHAIRSYPGAFLAVAGSADPLSAYLKTYVHNAPGAVKENLLLHGADHIFNILETPERFAPDVLEKTTTFFASTL